MPKRSFALERGGPKRLDVEWSGIWKNMRISLDSQPIGGIPDGKALKAGQTFELPDKSSLSVRLVQSLGNAELQILRDGAPLPGSGSDPVERLKVAWAITWFIAGLNTVLGIVAMIAKSSFLEQAGLGIGTVIEGAIFFLLGWLVKTYRSAIALGIAVALFAVDGLLSLVASTGGSRPPPVGMIVMRVILILPMIRGFSAIRALKSMPDTQGGSSSALDSSGGRSNDPWQGPGGAQG
jgi:hypothetical protein